MINCDMDTGHDGRTLRQLHKLLTSVNAGHLCSILTTDTVTSFLEDSLGADITPIILYQGPPYVYPPEVPRYFTAKDIMQRDIRIEVPSNTTGRITTVLFASSWIATNALDKEFMELLGAGKMTIGQIIRKSGCPIEYQNLGYSEISPVNLPAVFKTKADGHMIRRSRMLCLDKKPVIIIHEFIPV